MLANCISQPRSGLCAGRGPHHLGVNVGMARGATPDRHKGVGSSPGARPCAHCALRSQRSCAKRPSWPNVCPFAALYVRCWRRFARRAFVATLSAKVSCVGVAAGSGGRVRMSRPPLATSPRRSTSSPLFEHEGGGCQIARHVRLACVAARSLRQGPRGQTLPQQRRLDELIGRLRRAAFICIARLPKLAVDSAIGIRCLAPSERSVRPPSERRGRSLGEVRLSAQLGMSAIAMEVRLSERCPSFST